MPRPERSHAASVLALATLTLALLLPDATAHAQRVAYALPNALEKHVATIPMRDGAKLHTEIYVPRRARGPLPIIMERTPYGLNHDQNGYSMRLLDHPDLIEQGYIMVFQDLRGRYASEGEYVTLRPPTKDPNGVDETTDTWDTIDWLVKNVPDNNGRVGILGISYGGFTSLRAMQDPHPALKAASPQASCADMFVGDDWHHNGAFRLEYAFNWIAGMESGRERSTFAYDQHDLYEFFLDLGPLANVNRNYFHGTAPSWNAFTEHPDLDAYWEEEMCGILPFLQEPTVPALHVVGWYDAEDFYGPLKVYRELETRDTADWNHLVMGPWTHGGWTFNTGQRILDLDFGSATGRWYKSQIEAPWFAHWLKGAPKPDLPEVLSFQTGSNVWESFDRWPPAERTEERGVYLLPGGRVGFEPPADRGDDAFDAYVSDPANPVPYRERPITRTGWFSWQAEDQRIAHGRPDVLVYESEPLEEALTLTGDPVAHLFASTTGTDSDWIVKLIDVFPDDHPRPELRGYQYMVAGEVFRGRYRNSYREPEPVPADEVVEYTIHLRDRNHRFEKGHRIMVQIQSTWFPVVDRNPQTWVPSIYEATEADFRAATQRIYRSARYPTRITLPVRTDGGIASAPE